jgi:hypothetical protein
MSGFVCGAVRSSTRKPAENLAEQFCGGCGAEAGNPQKTCGAAAEQCGLNHPHTPIGTIAPLRGGASARFLASAPIPNHLPTRLVAALGKHASATRSTNMKTSNVPIEQGVTLGYAHYARAA